MLHLDCKFACQKRAISLFPDCPIFFCLFALSFSFSVGHVGFSSMVNKGFQVFGQFQNLYQIYKLLHRDRSVVNTKGCEKNASLFFRIAAFVVHGFPQTLLHIQRRRMAVRSSCIILVGFPVPCGYSLFGLISHKPAKRESG